VKIRFKIFLLIKSKGANGSVKRYAIFFPQFNQIEVNDLAWGYGFTDWVLVATANAFDYWKRRAPVVGYYDLSNPEVFSAQIQVAINSGIQGFGIYHYWFEDGLELGAVERHLLRSYLPENFGYFFIWANESWTKRWAGKNTEILKFVSTSPSNNQIRDHVNYLKPFMESESYTTVLDRPLFVIYRPEFFRNPVHTVDCYRDEFNRIGVNPLIGYCIKSALDVEYSSIFDFCYLFEPRLFFNFRGFRKSKLIHSVFRYIIHSMHYSKVEYWSEKIGRLLNGTSKTHPFSHFLEYFYSPERKHLIDILGCPSQNVLSCGWNNAPRYRERFTELEVPTEEQFALMLSTSLEKSGCLEDLPLLCNAWNEWSEGAAIEPCRYLGDSLLKSYLS
jgi:hypothetical protein